MLIDSPRSQRRSWELTLSPAEREALHSAAAQLAGISLVDDPEAFITEAQVQADGLPESLRRAVYAFRRWGNRHGGLLIRGVPIGTIPPTPQQASNAIGSSLFAAGAMSVLAALLGEQYGFRAELSGNPIQDILPEAGAEDTQRSVSSKTPLLDHVEMVFTDYRADYVGLLCVRADHERVAGTTLSSVYDILPRLDHDALELLRQPLYKTTVDESFLIGLRRKEAIWVGPIAVIGGSPERPTLRADFAETQGLTAEAQRALQHLQQVEQEERFGIRLAAGDVLWIANHTAFHGRTAFVPRYDGSDRWLLRTFVTKNLDRSAAARPGDGRVIDTDFAHGPNVL